MKSTNNIRLLAAAALMLGASHSHAADITWANSAGNTTWTSDSTINSAPASASWVGGVAPTNNVSTDTAIFTSVTNAQPVLTVQTRITGVDFQMAAGGLAMDGGGGIGQLFQTGAGGIDSTLQTSGTNTITNARILTTGAANTWNLFSSANTTSTSTFTFDSVVELGQNLTIIGQRNSTVGNVGIINFERAITASPDVRTLTINSSNTNNTVNLKGVNTYLGVTNVNGGIVNVQNDQRSATGGWNIQTPNTAGVLATVNFATGSQIEVASANKIQIGSTANSGSHPASTLNVAGTVDNDGALQMERNSNLNLNNGAVWVQAGNLTLTARGGGPATLTVNAGAEMTYTGSTTVNLTTGTAGSALLNINGTGQFTTAAGFQNTTGADTGSGFSRITLTDGGTLRLSANVANLTTQTQLALAGTGGVIDNAGFNTTLSGANTAGSSNKATGITGTGGLTSTGNGTLTLTGANTYTGATLVSAGTLLVNGSLASGSAVTVGANGILGGNGTIGGATIINGSLRPGNSIGTLTVTNDVTWNSGEDWVFELGTGGTVLAPGDSDRLSLTGAGNEFLKGSGASGSFVFDFAGTGSVGWYKLVSWESTTASGFAPGDFFATNLTSGLSATFTVTDTIGAQGIYLNVIPEPSTWTLLGIGLATLAVFRRRRA